jgi:protein-S-isoprenylcysteine O-methyltransferase Ste14
MWLGVGVFLLSYTMYAEVMRENAYLSRTIEIQEGQQVIDSGLYAIVRHPMYTATILLFLSIPVILGSLISFLVMLLYIPIIAQRIRYEEQFLDKELDGYREYKKRVRYKITPFIW